MQLIKIKHLLLDRGLTIQEIAVRAGVSRPLVSLMFKGERKAYRHRAKVARILGLSVEELFGGNGKKRRAA